MPAADVIREAAEPYRFAPAVPRDHFLSRWISYAASRTDAAHEYHEAAALVLLASATPTVRARLAPYPHGLPTNLFVLLVGDSTTSRKSTSKDLSRDVQYRALPGSLSPDHFSPEAFVEHMAGRANDATTLFVDEFGELLEKLHHAKHMAGLRGFLMTIYAGPEEYEYRRHSKRGKDGTRIEDSDRLIGPHLSILGATTPAVFEFLTERDVTSGLLPRFAIIMPESKPARRPFHEVSDGLEQQRNELVTHVGRLHAWATERRRIVRFAPGVLERLDEFFETEFDAPVADRSETGRRMLERLQAMTVKVAMLSAAGWPESVERLELEVGDEDADAAIGIIRRWTEGALAFAGRVGESDFERKLERCLRLVQERRRVPRKIVARNCHVEKRVMDAIQETLVDRGLIRTVTTETKGGGPRMIEWEILR